MDLTYDSMGHVINTELHNPETSGGKSITTVAAYTADGDYLTSQTNALGNTTTYQTNDRGLTTEVKDPMENKVLYDYNANTDQLETVSLEDGTEVEYIYAEDMLANIVRKSLLPDGTEKEQNYQFTYDKYDNVTSIKVGNRTLASYEYMARNGPLKKITYGNGFYIEYEYDVLGRVIAEKENGVLKYKYLYGASGQMNRQEELNASGTVVKAVGYEYDSLGRLIRSWEEELKNGYLARTVSSQHLYDNSNRLKEQSWSIGSDERKETYTYDAEDGTLKEFSFDYEDTVIDVHNTINYYYDNLKRLESESDNFRRIEYTYQDVGENGTSTQLESMKYQVSGGSFEFGYEYDKAQNITKIVQNGTTATEYTYDDQYQLTKEKLRNNTLVYDYSYDTAGNILSMSETKNGTTTTKNFTYGDAQWQDLLTAVNGNSITYDAIGNPLQYHNGKNWTFTWVKGRSLNTAVSGDTIASYQYGSDGVRIKKTVGDKVHEYTYLGGVLVEDRCGEDTIRFTYDGQGRPHSMTYQGETYFYILNQQGDVLCLMNNDRGVMASYEYNAWGEVLNVTGILGDVNPLRYRGYYYDSETGFYYLNSRYYDPEIGRFINSDDMIAGIGDNILGYNMFAYCFNNPVNMSDSDGNWPEWLDKAINAVAKTVKKAVKVATKWVKKAKKKVEKICGFTTQIDKEKPIKPKYRGIVSCETGSGYNKSFSTGKSVNIYNTIPNISEDIFDAGIGIDFNINGYGASMQNGVESSFSINLPKQSFEVGSRPLGRKYFKYSYIDSSGVYAYQKYILNTPELGGALLLLYYQPNIALVGAAGLAGGAYAY